MVDVGYENNDRWSIPDDRQLALRGRLQTGWSSYKSELYSVSKKTTLSEDEFKLLQAVLQKRDRIQLQEQHRIGGLVKKLEHMRMNVRGDGQTTCLICDTKAGLVKDQLRYCAKCSKMVCPKCSIETTMSVDFSLVKSFFCVLCYEERQLWKRSGAWFFNSMPKYTVLENGVNDLRKVTIDRHSGSLRSSGSSYGHGSLNELNDQDDSNEDDDGSDSDADETSSIRAFDIPDNRKLWHAGIVTNDEDNGNIKRRNAISTQQNSTKGTASKTSSFELSPAEDNVDGIQSLSVTNKNDQRYNSERSLNSLNENSDIISRGLMARNRRESQGSLSSEGGGRDRRSKLNFRTVFKHGKEGGEKSSTFERSPLPGRKSPFNGDADSPMDSVSQAGSDHDIDAMFKNYENEQTKPAQQVFTGKYGMIEFTLQYDPNTQELLVIVHNCKGLKDTKSKVPAMPYVRTFILPEAAKATKQRTPAIKKASDPVYNHSLLYHGISNTDLLNKGLRLSVMDENKTGNGSIIGETSISLKNLSTRPVQQFRRILDLKSNDDALFLDSKNTSSDPGRIELALHYLSKQNKLVVGIIRCAGLKALDPNGYSDPYVKCYLLPDPSKKTKQKTQVKKKTLNPEFNEEFQYKIAHSELAKRTLHVSVWDYDMGRANDFIGGITLGVESSGDLLRHWFETLQTQDRRVIKWHTLSETCPIINE